MLSRIVSEYFMSLSRSEFLKKACVSGACLCGFTSLTSFSSKNKHLKHQGSGLEEQNDLTQEWVANLLSELNSDRCGDSVKPIIKKLASVHYHDLNMDAFLQPYIGNLEK